jgi:hypothetical protein
MLTRETLKQMAVPLSEKLSEFKKTAHVTRPDEVSLNNTAQTVTVHLREDDMLEMATGECGFFMDGGQGVVASSSPKLLFSNHETAFYTPSFSINGSRLNQVWLGANSEASPLTLTEEGANAKVITGVPQPGQSSVPLSELVNGKRLFFEPVQSDPMLQEISKLKKLLEELDAS